jgi:hypothetical protein
MDTLLDFLHGERCQVSFRARRHCFVSQRNGGTEVSTGRFEAGVRSALTGTMNAHESFEEVTIGQIASLSVKLADGNRFRESPANFGFVFRLHPNQHRIDIARIKRLSGCSYDRTVQSIAVG